MIKTYNTSQYNHRVLFENYTIPSLPLIGFLDSHPVDLGGKAVLGGIFPLGSVYLEGTPVQGAQILIYLRESVLYPHPAICIKKLITDESGSWELDSLNKNLKFDVVCQLEGFNDLVLSNILPEVE
ncbi:hypothetical protein ACG9YX_13185 [Acinetobacter nematophilus]|uniref:hypothetical protein n=1 Tax=Acinetobacter nematophilus TaxID=2994642 RepID=UPI003AF5F492